MLEDLDLLVSFLGLLVVWCCCVVLALVCLDVSQPIATNSRRPPSTSNGTWKNQSILQSKASTRLESRMTITNTFHLFSFPLPYDSLPLRQLVMYFPSQAIVAFPFPYIRALYVHVFVQLVHSPQPRLSFQKPSRSNRICFWQSPQRKTGFSQRKSSSPESTRRRL